jgi:hypothetical protein
VNSPPTQIFIVGNAPFIRNRVFKLIEKKIFKGVLIGEII